MKNKEIDHYTIIIGISWIVAMAIILIIHHKII